MRILANVHDLRHAWQRGVFAGCLVLLASLAHAATLTVGCTGTTGDTTALINAINTANNEISNPGLDTIELTEGCTYSLTAVDNWWYGPNGLPAIASVITIEGNGAEILRSNASGTPDFRFFYVSGGLSGLSSGALTLHNLSLSNGIARGGASGAGAAGAGMGGAIFNQGDLTLSAVTLFDNQALGGNTNIASAGFGGGGMGQSGSNAAGGGFGGAVGDFGGDGGIGSVSGGGGGGGGGFAAASVGGIGTSTAAGLGGGDSGWGSGAGDGGDGAFHAGTIAGGNGGNFGSGGLTGSATASGSGGGGGGIGGGGGSGYIGGNGGFGGGGGFGAVGGDGGFGGGSATSDHAGFGAGIGNGSAGGGGAGMGGAIFNHNGSLSLVNCTLTANTAQGGVLSMAGAAAYNNGAGLGGAIFNLQGSVTILQSTLAFNTAINSNNLVGPNGGAVYNVAYLSGTDGGALSTTSSVNLINSILSNSSNGSVAIADLANAKPAMANGLANIGATTVTADSHSLVSITSGITLTTMTGDPHLNPLANNGGPTPTLSLCRGSPAIDAGNPAAPNLPSTDQRGPGYPRIIGSAPDIGAFEFNPAGDEIFGNGFDDDSCGP